MYSFVGQRGRCISLLFLAVIAFCQANKFSGAISSSTDSEGSPQDLPCLGRNNRISLHGETYKMTECSSCTCNNSTLSCAFESCQPSFCRKPVHPPGVCCRVCPYNIAVTGVVPEVSPGTSIRKGTKNEIILDLNVGYLDTRETTSIYGADLWTTRVWMSSFQDGSNELKGTVVEEALSEGQRGQDLTKTSAELFTIPGIRYAFDLTDHSCGDAKYVCAKFNKGPNPVVEKTYLDFHFEAVPTEVLTGCTKITDCTASSTEGSLYPQDLPCRDNRNRISLHGETYKMTECSKCTCNNSTLSCAFESCAPSLCRQPVHLPGVCCSVCPHTSSTEGSLYPQDLPCRDNRNKISLHGETYKMTECSKCTCNNSTLSCAFETCAPSLCRQPVHLPGVCCSVCPHTSSTEGSLYPQDLPCRDNRNRISLHGETYKMTECSKCTCNNSTLSCAFETCAPSLCRQPVHLPGVCCSVCPHTSSTEESLYPQDLPCKDNSNRISLHGETYKMTECSKCTCNNSTLSCAFESCAPSLCRQPVHLPGVCCSVCPHSSEPAVPENEESSGMSISLSGPELAGRLQNGVRVVRGDDWKWGNQDGNPPGEGSIVGGLRSNGWINVRWDIDTERTYIYRMGAKGKYDLNIVDATRPQDDESSSSSEGSPYPQQDLPCRDNSNRISLHGETYKISDCASCTCNNSTLSCAFQSCAPSLCRQPVRPPGVCCRVCPYNVAVTGVVPEVAPGTSIRKGTINDIILDLNVGYLDTRETTSIAGADLWTTRVWMSSFQDGSNELKGTVVEEALTEGQRGQDLTKTSAELFTIPGIRYAFDLTDHSCGDAKYVCAKFNKGPNPVVEKTYLDFHFEAVPTKMLTGCTEITDCISY